MIFWNAFYKHIIQEVMGGSMTRKQIVCCKSSWTKLPFGKGEDISIAHVIAGFDIMKYHPNKGKYDYPVLFMMARIQFSRLDNLGFQERVFSMGRSAMSNN